MAVVAGVAVTRMPIFPSLLPFAPLVGGTVLDGAAPFGALLLDALDGAFTLDERLGTKLDISPLVGVPDGGASLAAAADVGVLGLLLGFLLAALFLFSRPDDGIAQLAARPGVA